LDIQEQNSAVDNARRDTFGDYRFHDPAWMAWWLTSMYLLPTQDQITIAEKVLLSVHSPDSRAVLTGFIEYQRGEYTPPFEIAVDPEPVVVEPSIDPDDHRPMTILTRITTTVWQRYPKLVVGAGVVLGFYMWNGLKSIFSLFG
jgi:hypothetical protein